MNKTRRNFLQSAALVTAGALANASPAQSAPPPFNKSPNRNPANPKYLPVLTPDVPNLPHELDNGVKVFHLVAEPVQQEIFPGKILNLWGYNGSAPGPTIQVTQGDRVRIIVDNHLPEPTSMHWHGFDIPFAMDGGPGLSQDAILPGGRFVYEFTLQQEGTYFYHSHMAMQEMMGMIGAFIMHPQEPYDPPADQDFAIILQEYAVLPNNPTPNSMNMEFNWLTMNGKSGPATTPLVVRLGDRVRLRLINLGMDHHPIHMHGHQFVITGTEGGRQPKSTWGPNNTVLVGVAQARAVEFVATNPGDWMIHCHMPHHMMNQMSSMAGPLTRRAGMPAGVGMEEGMGMPRGGNATSEENGPSLGRGMGASSNLAQPTTNGPLTQQHAEPNAARDADAHADMQPHTQMNMQMQMQMASADVSKNANSVPGFPQDAFMESPADGHGRSRRQTRNLRPAPRLERLHARHDDANPRPPARPIRSHHQPARKPAHAKIRPQRPTCRTTMKSSENCFLHGAPGRSDCCNTRDLCRGFVGALLAAPQLARASTPPQHRMKTSHGRFAMTQNPLRTAARQILCALALALTLANIAAAQSAAGPAAPTLTLDQLQKIAITNNPTLAQAQAGVRAAAGRARQSGLWPNPTIGYMGEEIRGGSFGGGQQGVFAQQDIILGNKLGQARKVLTAEGDQAKAEAAEQRLRVETGVRIAFYQSLAAQQMVATRAKLSALAQDAVATTRQLFNVGQADQPDVLQAEVEADQAALAVLTEQQEQQRAWRVLAAVVGQPGTSARAPRRQSRGPARYKFRRNPANHPAR